MLKKLRNKKGFTLAELLIVVAIIGVLVAVSIPIFTAQLRKARLATNQANARAGYAACVATLLENEKSTGQCTYSVSSGTATYVGDTSATADAKQPADWGVDDTYGVKLGDVTAASWTIDVTSSGGKFVGTAPSTGGNGGNGGNG